MILDKIAGCLVVLVLGISQIDALMCWSCSSDLDIRCHDHFNTTKFDRFYNQQTGGNYQSGGYNTNYQQNYQGRNNYNQGYNQGYQNNPYQSRPTVPYVKTCTFSSYGDKKTVCMKKVSTSNDQRTLTIRDCVTIPNSQSVGKCPSESNSYIQVDFCEYCDTDGCNSGSSLQVNVAVAALSFIAIFCLRQ
ncbi:uncharacterized protein LOC123317079 [Coccinella septempunctata]|uniref:uncharacterized protein LOC123317079 n=1 Tax=Coccinella septempunctata TaxID=41139 RepID=UPI001D06A58D|nr:uncharacterized protein LOC123317079 [Coccinella septempunctata]